MTPDGMKYYDTNHNDLYDIGTADIVALSICTMAEGYEQSERIGNCIVVGKVEIHAELILKAQAPLENPLDPKIWGAVMRVVPYLDTQTDTINPIEITDIFKPNNDEDVNCYAFPNQNNENRFMFLDDVKVDMHPNIMFAVTLVGDVAFDSCDRVVKHLFLEYETDIEVRFNDAGFPTSGNIGLAVLASNDDLTAIRWYTRIFYRDT